MLRCIDQLAKQPRSYAFPAALGGDGNRQLRGLVIDSRLTKRSVERCNSQAAMRRHQPCGALNDHGLRLRRDPRA
jgi:hypothetical protein